MEATLPLTGSYAGVRRFVAEVLNELPHSALESLQIERATAQAKELQATARFVLFYGEETLKRRPLLFASAAAVGPWSA